MVNYLWTASPAHPRPGPAGSSLDSPKPFHSQGAGIQKQEKPPPTGSILNLNLGETFVHKIMHEITFILCAQI